MAPAVSIVDLVHLVDLACCCSELLVVLDERTDGLQRDVLFQFCVSIFAVNYGRTLHVPPILLRLRSTTECIDSACMRREPHTSALFRFVMACAQTG